jgi:hypothetical protein
MVDADGVAGYCDSMGGNRKSKQASQFRVRSNVTGATASKKPCRRIMRVRGICSLCQAACLAVASAKAGGSQENPIPASRRGRWCANDHSRSPKSCSHPAQTITK